MGEMDLGLNIILILVEFPVRKGSALNTVGK